MSMCTCSTGCPITLDSPTKYREWCHCWCHPLPKTLSVELIHPEWGYDFDVETTAQLGLAANTSYEVKTVLVGNFITHLELSAFPGVRFNSVQFETVRGPLLSDLIQILAKHHGGIWRQSG